VRSSELPLDDDRLRHTYFFPGPTEHIERIFVGGHGDHHLFDITRDELQVGE
jgi:hypothetical protein